MATFGMQFQFWGVKQGWRELWYLQGITGMGPATTAAIEFARARTNLIGTPVVLEGVTLWDVLAPGFRHFEPLNFDPKLIAPPIGAADSPWNAVRVVVEAPSGRKRQFWLRGIPDEALSYTLGGKPKLDNPDLTKYWNNFQTDYAGVVAGRATAFSLQRYDRTLPKKPVVDVVLGAGTSRPVITVTAHGYNTDDLVALRRLKGTNIRPMVRRGNVIKIDDNSFQLRQVEYPSGISLTYVPDSGFVQKVAYVYEVVNIAGAKVIDFRKKSTGGIIGVSRGRARKRPVLFL